MRPTVGLLAVAAMTGCKQGLPKMPDLSEVLPKVRFKDVKVSEIDFGGLDAKLVLEVDNPYPLGLQLAEKSWTLDLAGQRFLDGTDDEGLDIEPAATSPVRIPVSMKWADAFGVATNAKGKDQLPFALHADLGFTTPIGDVRVPLDHEGELPALHKPKISLKALRVEKLDLLKQTASLALDVNLESDQGSPLSFDAFAWDLSLNGSDAAAGTARIGAVEASQLVTLPIDLKLLGIGVAIVDAIKDQGKLDVALKANADVATPFGVVPLKVNEVATLRLQ